MVTITLNVLCSVTLYNLILKRRKYGGVFWYCSGLC